MDAQMPPNMASMAGPQGMPTEGEPSEAPTEGEDTAVDSELQAEVQRGMGGIVAALYKDKAASDQFLNMLNPEKKVDSLVRASILLVTELDKKMNLAEEALAPMIAIAAGELMELAEAGKGMAFSEMEQKQIVMASFEGILQAYDVDPQAAADFVGQVGPEAEKQGIAEYDAALKGGAAA